TVLSTMGRLSGSGPGPRRSQTVVQARPGVSPSQQYVTAACLSDDTALSFLGATTGRGVVRSGLSRWVLTTGLVSHRLDARPLPTYGIRRRGAPGPPRGRPGGRERTSWRRRDDR